MRQAVMFALLVVAAGCGGGPRGEVEGVVRRGGKPLADVVVTFLPDAGGQRAVGITDKEGRYSLRSENSQPGVAAGSYRVVLEDLAINSAPRSADGTVTKLPPPRFPATFSDPLRTSLRQQVHSGPNVIPLELP